MLGGDDDAEFESLLAQLPLPAPTSKPIIPPTPKSTAPPPVSISFRPPVSAAPARPPAPPLSIPQLLTEWDNIGKEFRAGTGFHVNRPGDVITQLVKRLYADVEAERRVPVSHQTDSGPAFPAKRVPGQATLASFDNEEDDYRAALSAGSPPRACTGPVVLSAARSRDSPTTVLCCCSMLSRVEVAEKARTDVVATVMDLLLDSLCRALHELMWLLNLPGSPLVRAVLSPPATSSPSVPPNQLLYLASVSFNLAQLAGSLHKHSHCVHFTHYALSLASSFPSVTSVLPTRPLRLLLLAAVSELAFRASRVSQGHYGECLLHEAVRLRETDAADGAAGEDEMPGVLELQGRMLMLAGKAAYVRKAGEATKLDADISEETFDVEQRLRTALQSGRWSEQHCQLILASALTLRLSSVAKPVLQRIIRAFPSRAPHRQELLCALSNDSEAFAQCSALLSKDADVVGFAVLRFLTEDCWTRGVMAVRRGGWEDGQRLMRVGLQLLQRSSRAADRPDYGEDGDEGTVAMMQRQIGCVQARREELAKARPAEKREDAAGKGKRKRK